MIPNYTNRTAKSGGRLQPPAPRTRYGSTSSDATGLGASKAAVAARDDDESLYLVWTHQWLVDQGYAPAPLSTQDSSSDDDADDDDESSLSSYALSMTQPSLSVPSKYPSIHHGSPAPAPATASTATATGPASMTSYSLLSWLTFCFN
ncbi:hypothetical protein BC940DRAFT_313266 [Gongronella butleri]|nr:hypothetical protein BC940DRAFT_313266 [Gongronella butleri]